jgi:hypothetical protein
MGNLLDILRIRELVEVPTTVNTDYISDSVDLSFREAAFSIQVDYDNGIGVDMTLYVEYSVDGNTYVRDTENDVIVSDATHTHIWDIEETGTAFMRVGIEVRSGSIDLQQILVKQKRRH